MICKKKKKSITGLSHPLSADNFDHFEHELFPADQFNLLFVISSISPQRVKGNPRAIRQKKMASTIPKRIPSEFFSRRLKKNILESLLK